MGELSLVKMGGGSGKLKVAATMTLTEVYTNGGDNTYGKFAADDPSVSLPKTKRYLVEFRGIGYHNYKSNVQYVLYCGFYSRSVCGNYYDGTNWQGIDTSTYPKDANWNWSSGTGFYLYITSETYSSYSFNFMNSRIGLDKATIYEILDE